MSEATDLTRVIDDLKASIERLTLMRDRKIGEAITITNTVRAKTELDYEQLTLVGVDQGSLEMLALVTASLCDPGKGTVVVYGTPDRQDFPKIITRDKKGQYIVSGTPTTLHEVLHQCRHIAAFTDNKRAIDKWRGRRSCPHGVT